MGSPCTTKYPEREGLVAQSMVLPKEIRCADRVGSILLGARIHTRGYADDEPGAA